MEIPALAKDGHSTGAGLYQSLHISISRDANTRFTCTAEGRHLSMNQIYFLHPSKELKILGITAWPTTFDIANSQIIQFGRYFQFILHRKSQALTLSSIPQGSVINTYIYRFIPI
jgi:hypothetical protein